MPHENLPVAVLGAGPVGLAAAVHLLDRGLEPLVLEAASSAGAHVAAWGHVRMFSPWRYDVDPVARRRLAASGWDAPPDDEFPTGRELLERYLLPLSRLPDLASRIRYGHRVTAVGRAGFDRMKSRGRDAAPFDVAYRHRGEAGRLRARAVIDATGTWATPNPVGEGGLPAIGEAAAGDQLARRIPDVRGRDRERFAGRRILVVGGGDSAFTVLVDLAALAAEAPGTEIEWAIRSPAAAFGGGAADQLPERGALGGAVERLVRDGRVRLTPSFQVRELRRAGDSLVVLGDGQALEGVDVVVAATGFRPDHSIARELRLALDPATESAVALGPLIDPNVHSCGTVPPHGVDELSHPDAGYHVVGIKSYGRAPTFLLLTGYEQVRSVVAALAGDWAAARDVRLVLPETGVCAGPAASAPASTDCCSTAAAATEVGSN